MAVNTEWGVAIRLKIRSPGKGGTEWKFGNRLFSFSDRQTDRPNNNVIPKN